MKRKAVSIFAALMIIATLAGCNTRGPGASPTLSPTVSPTATTQVTNTPSVTPDITNNPEDENIPDSTDGLVGDNADKIG